MLTLSMSAFRGKGDAPSSLANPHPAARVSRFDDTTAATMDNSLSVFVPRLPPLRSPTVPHADAAVVLPYC